MALETILEKLIVAVEANTAAVKAMGGGAAPAAAPKTPVVAATAGKPKSAAVATLATETAVDFDTVKAAGVKVMDTLGKPFAKKLIKEVTGADALPAVKKEKYGALVKAFEKALEDAANGGDEEEAADEEDEL